MKLIDGDALKKAMTVAAVSDRKSATRTWTKAICLIHDAKVIDPEEIIKETYLEIANEYDVSDLHSDSDKVACVASRFRQIVLEKLKI